MRHAVAPILGARSRRTLALEPQWYRYYAPVERKTSMYEKQASPSSRIAPGMIHVLGTVKYYGQKEAALQMATLSL